MDSALQDILAACSGSTEMTAKVFFPDQFFRPFTAMHQEIFSLIDDPKIPKVAIAGFRGMGKTSSLQLAYSARKLLFNLSKYKVNVSLSAESAIEQSENLKKQLSTNQLIQKVYGDIRGNSWAKESWTTAYGCKVLPRGAGQQIRGLLHEYNRPDDILLDDIEDREGVKNELRRKELKNWLASDVEGCIDQGKGAKIVLLGTVLHEVSLLAELLQNKSWESRTYEICGDDGVSLWPALMTTEQVLKKMNDHREAGTLGEFYREYRNLPIATEDSPFRAELFRYYTEDDLVGMDGFDTIALVDPARTAKAGSAESAIVIVSIHMSSGKIYIRDVESGHFQVDAFIERLCAMCAMWRVRTIGLETSGLDDYVTYPVKNAMAQKLQYCQVVEIKQSIKKEDRVGALGPFYKRNQVYHKKGVCDRLEAQLLSYPRPRLWDIMDAFANLVKMFSLSNRYIGVGSSALRGELTRTSQDAYNQLRKEMKCARVPVISAH